ncbi:hypothetical protein X992_4336 [Burkholderia pseudomallei MSHR5492]|nr:hypothetical protein X992_4336 [Burkholderia pseudomallei MSHR5492]
MEQARNTRLSFESRSNPLYEPFRFLPALAFYLARSTSSPGREALFQPPRTVQSYSSAAIPITVKQVREQGSNRLRAPGRLGSPILLSGDPGPLLHPPSRVGRKYTST